MSINSVYKQDSKCDAVLGKNFILKYGRTDSGLSSLGAKSPFLCEFSINFLKYF